MHGPENTLSMMGGMFTKLKVRDHLRGYSDPGWYEQPYGTRAHKL